MRKYYKQINGPSLIALDLDENVVVEFEAFPAQSEEEYTAKNPRKRLALGIAKIKHKKDQEGNPEERRGKGVRHCKVCGLEGHRSDSALCKGSGAVEPHQ